MKPNCMIINTSDNVAIALEEIAEGATALLPNGENIRAFTSIHFSHKIALRDISAGEDIVKYGEVIGQATQNISKGAWVHTHNLDIKEES